MEPELRIRSAQESDLERILELVQLTLGEGPIPRSREYLAWKHSHNPFGRSAVIIAESGGVIIGLRAFMRWMWKCGGEKIPAVRPVDTATHPDWRGRGIFTRLTTLLVEQMKKESVTVIYNTPNRFSRPGYIKMGWKDLGRVSLWIRPRFSLSLGRKVLLRKLDVVQEPLNHITGVHAVSDLIDDTETELLRDLQEPDEFALRTIIDAEYLRWRYVRIPKFRYFAHWKQEDRGAAAVVFRVSRRAGLVELRFCQILSSAHPHTSRVVAELLSDVAKKVYHDYAVSMSTCKREIRGLTLAGFIPAPRMGPILTVRQLHASPSAVNLLHRSSWRPSIGDLELF